MTSTGNHSSGASSDATPRCDPPEIPGDADPLADLIARSEAAVDTLLMSMDWDAYDAMLVALADQSDRAAQLLMGGDTAFTPGAGSGVHSGLETPPR